MNPFVIPPRTKPLLDREFRPGVLANREFRRAARDSGQAVSLLLGLERSDGSVSRYTFQLLPEGHRDAKYNFFFVERLCKFLLWSRGACRIHFGGPRELCAQLQKHYEQTATGKFDAEIMGRKIYERSFEIIQAGTENVPPQEESATPLGRHLDGCRIGFDLGASDRKAAAVIDGKVVFTEELPWNPRPQKDPQWHFEQIMESLRRAAAHLPRVDAIGGSSAGVYVNNRVKVASLFRGVPDDLFEKRVKDLFLQLRRAWNNIPFEVVNDGEVTALAGSMSLNANGVLGVALGSSQAAGYVTPQGNITSWLNELAFAPVDYHPTAPVDEWSGDFGCGVQYFSQQAVGRLLPASGLKLEASLSLPEKLVEVQDAMGKGDERAANIYQTIGVYLGYTVAHYAEFYDFRHLLVLGRVTTGEGGTVIVKQAAAILRNEFPEVSVELHLPDEKEKRHGQAIAAASLPVLDQKR